MAASFMAEIFQKITVAVAHDLKNWFQFISQSCNCVKNWLRYNLHLKEGIIVMSVQIALCSTVKQNQKQIFLSSQRSSAGDRILKPSSTSSV